MINLGVVVIGRNEGERLKRCIRSLSMADLRLVYVDSASTDESVAFVNDQGFDVIELDMSIPFSAARARNEGYRFLADKYPELEFIQFVDGDCEVVDGWLTKALSHLQANPKIVAVCGRRRERYPEQTIYNQICDIEWDSPVGFAKATGGDFMCRLSALIDVDGFNPQVVAGEEPELCFRLREQGWLIERIDSEMTWHDAAMTSWKQWWKRYERSGHAYAQGFFIHGASPEKYCRKDVLRILVWALLLPLFILLSAMVISPWCLIFAGVYLLKVAQLTKFFKSRFSNTVSLAYAISLVFGKFPQLVGVLRYVIKKISGSEVKIIEYK